MTPEELSNIKKDMAAFIECYADSLGCEPTCFTIAGGFARRMYMLDNGMQLKETDHEGDIDVFSVFKDTASDLYCNMPDDNSSEEVIELYNNDLHKFLSDASKGLIGTISECKVIGEFDYVPRARYAFQSQTFNRLQLCFLDNYGKVNNSATTIVSNNKSFFSCLDIPKFCIPLFDKLQIIVDNKDSVHEIVENFDIENAKFISKYPYDCAEYVGSDVGVITQPYVINDITLKDGNNYVKHIARLRKYSRYGFVFSEKVKDKIHYFAKKDERPIKSLVCYAKGAYL